MRTPQSDLAPKSDPPVRLRRHSPARRRRAASAWRCLWLSGMALLWVARCASAASAEGVDLVIVDSESDAEFGAAGTLFADGHSATRIVVDLADGGALEAALREHAPHDVVFVVAPQRLDLDLTHRVLESSTRMDADPFPDFRHGFVTGLDGAAARRFVQASLAARSATRGRRLGVLAVGEAGTGTPPALGAELAHACDLSLTFRGLPGSTAAERRRREALEQLAPSDLLLLFSHGEPDRMLGAFRGAELRSWALDLEGRVVVNCACFNGSPSAGLVATDHGIEFARRPYDSSVALALLDTGVAAYVAGMDAWHGPLAVRVTLELADGGATLGDATRAPVDRLVLTQLDRPLRFPAQDDIAARFGTDAVAIARGNAAGSVLFGDPSFAPFSAGAPRSYTATLRGEPSHRSVRIALAPLAGATAGYESMLLLPRLLGYFEPLQTPLTTIPLELYRVVDWPPDEPRPGAWRVVAATSGEHELACGTVFTAYEETPRGPRLHVVVPLAPRAGIEGMAVRSWLARDGADVTLAPVP